MGFIGTAWAHGEAAHSDALALGWAWTLDPLVLLPLLVAAFLYWRGLKSSWQRAGFGRGVRSWEAAAFAGGMLALFFALAWPLDALGERLFSAHMAQHLVLMNVAAPLLVLGAPLQVMARALPRRGQRSLAALLQTRSWTWLTGAAAATVLQQAALWTWHTPRGVAASLGSDTVHIAMHLSLVVAALLFWTAVLRPHAGQYGRSIAAVLATLKFSGMVSIVLLLRPGALFTAYGDMAAAWGLSPAEDEQLGWGLMMIVGTISYLIAAVALFARAFLGLEKRAPPSVAAASR